ncbi:hypothetical protein ACFX2I_007965 [Malus domestica]
MVPLRLMDTNIGDGFCTSVELDVPCANAGQDKPCLDRCTSKFPGSNGNKVQSQCGYVPGQGRRWNGRFQIQIVRSRKVADGKLQWLSGATMPPTWRLCTTTATNPGGKQRQEDQEGEVGERVGDEKLEPEQSGDAEEEEDAKR